MARFRAAMVGAAGPGILAFAVFIALLAFDDLGAAALLGSAIAQLLDPIIDVIILGVCRAARRWWHVVLGAIGAVAVRHLEPTSPFLAEPLTDLIMRDIALFMLVALCAAAAVGVRFIRHLPPSPMS